MQSQPVSAPKGPAVLSKLNGRSQFSKPQLAIFILAFGLIGYLLFKTFAAPNPSLPGDLNGDNTVNAADLSILLADYNTTNSAADINGDGHVNILDMSILLAHYGQSVSTFSTNISQNQTLNAPFTWTFNPGTTTTAGYFFADGQQLAKITGPGPYTFSITQGLLTDGAHTLGGSWDLPNGTHVTFPQSYLVTINNGTSGGGGTTFESVTNWARPSPGTPSAATAAGWHLVPFSTKTGLDSAIANMQPHDYIYYNGTGVLSINAGSTGNAYNISGHNPSSPVVIDFGVSRDLWDTTKVSGNYVQFTRSSTANGWDGVFIHDVSNLRIFGGDIGPNLYGSGIRVMGNTHDVTWWDFYVHNVGGSGVGIQPITQSGATSSIQNINFRGEVNRFALNPSLDSHADKGTGEHGVILHGNSGYFDNSTFAVYAHDSLRPGEVSVGQTWPEGGGGSALEAGTDSTGGTTSQNNDKYYVKGDNLLMIPNGTNPGSTTQQTGGNVINAWGSVPLNGNDFVWIEGNNDTGAVFHGTGGGWSSASPAILVEHGRHNNTDQTKVGQAQSTPYFTGYGIIYRDCL